MVEQELRHNREVTLHEKDLSQFIHRSKKLGFAGEIQKVSRSDGSSLYSNRELPWVYTDTYSGNTIERGSEDVYHDMVLVWSMQYRGGTYANRWKDQETVFSFLKEALLQIPEEAPFRGPKEFSLDQVESEGKIVEGKFVYNNQWEGAIGHFRGSELIHWDDEIVFYPELS